MVLVVWDWTQILSFGLFALLCVIAYSARYLIAD